MPPEGTGYLHEVRDGLYRVLNVGDQPIPPRGVMEIVNYLPSLASGEPANFSGASGIIRVRRPGSIYRPLWMVNAAAAEIGRQTEGLGTFLREPGLVQIDAPGGFSTGIAGAGEDGRLTPGLPGFMVLGRAGSRYVLAVQYTPHAVPAVLESSLGTTGTAPAYLIRIEGETRKKSRRLIRVSHLWLNSGEHIGSGTIIIAEPLGGDSWIVTQAACEPAQPPLQEE